MRIETTATEYVIRLDRVSFSPDDIERVLRNLRLQELVSRLGGSSDEANQLADEIMQQWWINGQAPSDTQHNA